MVELRHASALLAALLIMGGAELALAQRGPPPGSGGPPGTAADRLNLGSMSQSDLQGLADFIDTTKRLEHKNLVSKALARKRSATMLDALHIACQLTDAEHIASGKTTDEGQSANVGMYEAACANGMGYLLTLVGLSKASGISCFAASATGQRDTPSDSTGNSAANSGGGNLDLKCRLPANQDLNTMATTVTRNTGTACAAHGVKWLGQSGSPVLDYTEIACNEGQGFVLRTPAPGSVAAIDVLSCADAATHGAQCQMSAPALAAASTLTAAGGGPVPESPRPDLQWFKDALSKNGVSCNVTKARVVGRESIKRRYIVEYLCPQRPQGLVAYVPSPGDTAGAFESMDCAAAAERKLACQFVGTP